MNSSAGVPSLPAPKARALGVWVDALSLEQAAERVARFLAEAESDRATPARYVVTPNLDHAVQLLENVDLRSVYRAAALILPDGMPLVWAARWNGYSLFERVTGSDLTPRVLSIAPPGTKVFLLGGSDEASARAQARIEADYPNVAVVGRSSPPRGFEKDPAWSDRLTHEITSSGAELVILGLGAPKQELWAHAHAARLPGTVLLCVGATIDFLAGTVSRAPRFVQRIGLEWLYRMLSDPGRLVQRYAKDAWYLPLLLWRDRRGEAVNGPQTG